MLAGYVAFGPIVAAPAANGPFLPVPSVGRVKPLGVTRTTLPLSCWSTFTSITAEIVCTAASR